jgi:hypothetical protein
MNRATEIPRGVLLVEGTHQAAVQAAAQRLTDGRGVLGMFRQQTSPSQAV